MTVENEDASVCLVCVSYLRRGGLVRVKEVEPVVLGREGLKLGWHGRGGEERRGGKGEE